MSSFKITRADGKVLNASGCTYSAPRFAVENYASNKYSANKLPQKVDMRKSMTAIEDQGPLNSCTANAVAGAYEYLVLKNQGIEYDVSRLFIYYNARALKGEERKDCGSVISYAIEMLEKKGACSEASWPYDKKRVTTTPDKSCYKEAKQYTIRDTQMIPVDLFAWKHALAEGYPIIFGMTLFQSFDRQKRRGFVPMPSASDTARGSHGSHAMLCVGYSDVDKVFIVRNSWGTNWGDAGYCYIPYNYLMNEDYNHGDCWIIRGVDDVASPEDNWSNDDESVLVDVEDELSNMDDETWEAMNDEFGDYDLPYRLGALIAAACCMDEEFSDEEIEAAIQYLKKLLKSFNIRLNPKKVLENCMELASEGDFLEETVDILGRYLSPGALGKIATDMYEVAAADGDLNEEEEDFVNTLVGAWLEDYEPDEDEDEDDDEEYYYDDEDDEDDEEYDDDCDCDDDEDDEDDEEYDDDCDCDCDDDEEYDDDDDDEEYDDDDDEEYDDDDDEDDEDEDEEYDDDEDEEYDDDEDEEYDDDEDEDEDDEDEDEDEDDDRRGRGRRRR